MKTFWKTFLVLTLTVLCSIAMAAVLRADDDTDSAEGEEEDTAYACLVTPPMYDLASVTALTSLLS